ncbi:MAG TPA: pyridoxine 5'-phosphate synthase [Candidatus Omnitrophica bacterium]|nr:pyridoxine 5'-phosphate synthase [Candidatus Omnitrophota bacterium]
MKKRTVTLGVNIDHVATLRQARKEGIPDLVDSALACVRGGADSITVHLREDRRHIQDQDVIDLARRLRVPLNLEMAVNSKILKFALKIKPAKICLVPEKREELTTEGGLDLFQRPRDLQKTISALAKHRSQVSLFIDPDVRQIRQASVLGAPAIEIHTGSYANAKGAAQKKEWNRIKTASQLARKLGLHVHAGHGLDYENTAELLKIAEIEEVNIGYAIVCHSVFVGIEKAVKQMAAILKSSR